jgi:hypothetical protein
MGSDNDDTVDVDDDGANGVGVLEVVVGVVIIDPARRETTPALLVLL